MSLMTFLTRTLLLGSLFLSAATMLCAQQDQPKSTQPEEVVPVGPGYITRGYKTIVNGQVVQTTDGQVVQTEAAPPPPSQTPQTTPTGDWPQVVTIIDGQVVDPETREPVTNLPAEVELIPLGLRKVQTDVIAGGETNSSASVAPFFRVVAKNAKPSSPPANNQHPASMGPEGGPDFTELIESAESSEDESPPEPKTEETEEESGGFFDFLFGEEEPEPEEGKRVIDLEGPLTQEEMAMLQNDPQFQDYLEKRSSTSRHFYSSKGRGGGGRNTTPELPKRIIVEEFKPEEWEVEGPTPPTPNIAIGKLVSVDLKREIAVCWLQTRYLRPDRVMITRNYELETTGIIIPSGEQDGRSAGFWIAQGNPMPGDEVIVPGPDYAPMVERWQEQSTEK